MPTLAPFSTLHATNGMVCSVDHLASSAGVATLRAGGSAVDAAIAANAVLAVTSQHLCGLGGDLFALVHDGTGPPAALNASGRAGSGADPDRLRSEGHTVMPLRHDVRSATVPGCVDGWIALHERFGRLPLVDVLAPAIGYARDGFAASPLLAGAVTLLADVEGAGDLTRGHPYGPGTVLRRPGVARTLAAIATGGRGAFYEGEFGEGLRRLGDGLFTTDDLARSQADWVDPLGVHVWEHDAWAIPPNSQGYLTLAAARIADGLDLPEDPDDARWTHLLVEAIRQASHDRPALLHEDADGAALIAEERLAPRRAAIDPDRRTPLATAASSEGDTMYLCTADGEGMAVSLIQSNAKDFGAHVVEPSTGVFVHNRGIGFRLEPGHPAEYGPGRRPPHTLSPALVTRADGTCRAVLGTMGGDAQPQVVLQLLARLVRHRQSPAATVAARRWVLTTGGTGFDTWDSPEQTVLVEDGAPQAWIDGLRARGHDVEVGPAWAATYGHAHLIDRLPSGVLAGAADPRAVTGSCTAY
jgi:gamma-glutamyltranspeptidase/glutathione hydrolase